MTIIKCSECGKEISDKATSCPNCGCPVEKIIDKVDDVVEKETNTDQIPFNKSFTANTTNFYNENINEEKIIKDCIKMHYIKKH